jgi:hypothetical protein
MRWPSSGRRSWRALLQAAGPRSDEAVRLLRSLDPRPGARIGGGETEFIVPDAIAYRQGGVWKVATHAGSQPRLGINRHYERLIGTSGRDNDNYLRAQLQEARWLLKSLETRADTLLRVARAIVRQQSAFLEHGPQAMRPLTLREVAEELGLHESTISRATTRKYLRTPRAPSSSSTSSAPASPPTAAAAPRPRRSRRCCAGWSTARTRAPPERRQTGGNPQGGRHPRGPENCGKVPGSHEYSFFHGAPATLAGRTRHARKNDRDQRGKIRQRRGVRLCESRSAVTRWTSPRPCGTTRNRRWADWPSTSSSIWTRA